MKASLETSTFKENLLIRLGIDSRDVFQTHPRGVGKAVRTLITHLLPLLPEWQVTLFTNRNGNIHFSEPASIKHIDMPGDRFNAWENIRLPISALTHRLDLLHCPGQTAPSVSPCPFVLTVHDLIPVRIDDGWSSAQIDGFRRSLSKHAARARRIIAVSNFTKTDLLDFCRVSEDKIDVVHWGVQPVVQAKDDENQCRELLQSLGLAGPFFTAFAGGAPRKNVARILEALARFVQEVSQDVQLALLGVPDEIKHTLKTAVERLGLEKHLVLIGYLPQESVWQLLGNSEAMLYPSLYEGFGLPILEAMAAGAPVITSNVTSMPEVAGDAAILVDPTNVGAIMDAMRECYLKDGAKDEMRAKGYRRIGGFTWEKAAAATRLTYERALNLNV